MNKLKVFVTGCYDMLHSGHVAFLTEAASYGDLYVGIGSDKTINNLKGRTPVYTDKERLYMIKSLKAVKDSWINKGSGTMDFEEEIKELQPNIFFVNEDGFTQEKQDLCTKLGIELIVSKRIPYDNLPNRSTTKIRKECKIPFRLDLAGGWLDQPFVSKYSSGSVITISIEPDFEFNNLSGMASSTRLKAIDLWQTDIPEGNKEKLSKILFCMENPPGSNYISGSQDSIGIVYPGVNKLNYNNNYWPDEIISVTDIDTLKWIEEHIWLINLSPRTKGYNVLSDSNINAINAKNLSESANKLWESIINKDLKEFGNQMKNSFESQIAMFPNMINEYILEQINSYKKETLGWKISGAGGGGYLVLVSDHPIKNGIKIKIKK